ncbi:4-hydroxyphenylpyruvate dioxygenase [Nannochloropsis gaditana]|uniref:4-hydroxyphenylpyruvate dioxygenase n=2 Tax=Nannochloropsis gaditana TaxID=72520 RepID=W7TNB7_9STRA|nr:4-hydroxyphenylpyruvate dioxygenase [Nannochloropsis gaditana]
MAELSLDQNVSHHNGSHASQRVSELVGHKRFVRHNPLSDRFEMKRFHHLEFYCGDATNTSRRFSWGLGLSQVAKSDNSTGNPLYASYVLQSQELVFVFTAPYASTPPSSSVAAALSQPSHRIAEASPSLAPSPHPAFDSSMAMGFFGRHGLAVRAIGIEVHDASQAYEACLAHGGKGVLAPQILKDTATGQVKWIAEVLAYPGNDAEVVLRFVSGDFDGPFLPNYQETPIPPLSYGLQRIDHVVSNVPQLLPVVNHLMEMTGLHEYAEFTSTDVGTVDSGLNSLVLASNNERVLLPVNEPTFGTKRKSQIQTYLEQNQGAGVQHIALKTDNIFATMRELKKRTHLGGFDFMPKASPEYYQSLPAKIGPGVLTDEELACVEELGLLVDKDDQGVLLQVFTRPVGDRPTLFLEIIQRVGCTVDKEGKRLPEQAPGCGGFGKGNFSELFKSIEEYEKTLNV